MKKNVTRMLSALLAAVLLLSLCACGGGKDSGSDNRYDFGDYEVVYKGACIMTDVDGDDALVLTFDFTNNSDSAASYGWTVFETAVQEGTELEYTTVFSDLETFSCVGEDSFTDIEPGTTVEAGTTYKLNGMGKVKMTISDLLDHYTYTITVDPSELDYVEAKSGDGEDGPADSQGSSGPAADDTLPEPFLGWWNGDWYGWWTIKSGTGDYADYGGYWWDACAQVTVGRPAEDDSYHATMTIWDEDGSRTDNFIGQIDATISPYGVGDHGTLFSEGGYFLDDELAHADWIVDPALTEFENLLSIDGEYEGEEGSCSYLIVLRPWGVIWDDVTEESLPYAYDDWYLPWVNSGASMPDALSESFSGGSGEPGAPADTGEGAGSGGKLIPFTLEGETFNSLPFTLSFSLPEGEWDPEDRLFMYNLKIYNWPDGNDAPWGTPFIWFEFYDNEEPLNRHVDEYENLTETEERTIGGIAMKGRIYDYIGYEQMQEYYGVLPSGIGVSIRFVKVPASLLPQCHAILDTITFG